MLNGIGPKLVDKGWTIKKVRFALDYFNLQVNSQGNDFTNTIFYPGQFSSWFVVPKLIIVYTANGLSVQPSLKKPLNWTNTNGLGHAAYLANSSKLTSLLMFIFLAWICMIRARASSVGPGNSIFRSRRPERSKAGSRMSTRFVAAITW